MVKMWKIILLVVIMMMVVSPVYGFDEWTKEDTNRQIIFTVITLVDWGQTRTIATEGINLQIPVFNPDGTQTTINVFVYKYTEINPLLGKHPSIELVNTYFPVCMIGNYYIAKKLEGNWRKWWQILSITTETYFVTRNINIGVTIKL
jgi:hypothetical protein